MQVNRAEIAAICRHPLYEGMIGHYRPNNVMLAGPFWVRLAINDSDEHISHGITIYGPTLYTDLIGKEQEGCTCPPAWEIA